ncbi:MAG: class I SAM-dependent methyltransferase [Terracidiphilus sp.]|nr:class I SAM-dependent methyltransferase [Terracidiphilus sp.]
MRFLRIATGKRAPGSLLDIGCGDGSFLIAAHRIGWQVQGTEFSPMMARQRGITVVSDLSELPAGARFDCITLWHSFEHLRDPLHTMQRIRSLLAPAGVLLLAVPDSGGMQARLFGSKWFHLDVPRHLYHYGKRSLSTLLYAADLSPIRWRYQEFEYDLLGWSQSALNYSLPTPNVLFQTLTGRRPKCSMAEHFVSVVGGVVLTGLALPLLPIGSFVHGGATLVVEAVPAT